MIEEEKLTEHVTVRLSETDIRRLRLRAKACAEKAGVSVSLAAIVRKMIRDSVSDDLVVINDS